jgi:beta-aspartyl-peptidase (threonine type)
VYSLMIHGGAGRWEELGRAAEATAHGGVLRDIAATGCEMLSGGARALDVVERVVALLEDEPLFNAGRGSVLNADGVVTMDAAIMDGRDLRAGAVASLQRFANPVRVARAVLEHGDHVLLMGEGAARFALAQGFAELPDSYFLVPKRQDEWLRWKDGLLTTDDAVLVHGTVGAVARDLRGDLAAATSTGGRTGKHPGRVGDSCVVGAGVYADSTSCAVSTTGRGEDFMRTALAKSLACQVQWLGLDAAAAADAAMAELEPIGGSGGVIIVDRQGRCAARFNTAHMPHAWAELGGELQVAV